MADRTALRVLVGALMAAVSGLSATACAIDDALPPPSCTGGDTMILVAQSVATAELVPCFDRLPAGWAAANVAIEQDGTTIRFDSDRAGEGAATFRYTAACELGGAMPAPSEFDRAARYELVAEVSPSLRARRFYAFDGGCVTWSFDFDAAAPAALALELGDRLDLVTRDDLNRSLRESFIDEEV